LFFITQCSKEHDPEDRVRIPDKAFLKVLVDSGVDTNGDGVISYGEAQALTKLDVSGVVRSDYIDGEPVFHSEGKIITLKGIKAFINLDTLRCSGNQMRDLDLSDNTSLLFLDCSYNKLVELNITLCMNLELLRCIANQLTELDISNNIRLTDIDCLLNKLTYLDFSNNSELEVVFVAGNQMASLNLSNNRSLRTLYCDENKLTEINVSLCRDLEDLYCRNNLLTRLDVSQNPKIKVLVISNNPDLEEVCVWTWPFPPDHMWWVDDSNCPKLYYTTECSQ